VRNRSGFGINRLRGRKFMKKLELPYISERIRGFALPVDNELFIFDYDEVFKLSLENIVSVEILDDDPDMFDYKYPSFLGISEREPILQAGQYELSYEFNAQAASQLVTLKSKEKVENISFPTFSGDWFVATLTPCTRYLVIAEPYLIEIYLLD
jgi:hypothetical protein